MFVTHWQPVQSVMSRLKLDRRRLQAGHMRYAILSVGNRYHELTSASHSIASDVTITLQSIMPIYFKEFTKKICW